MGGVYGYDGTFGGFLALLSRLIHERILPEVICVEPPSQQSLFVAMTTMETDQSGGEEFSIELNRRLTPSCLRQIRTAFLADRPGRELIICRYLLLAWQAGKKIGAMLAHPAVTPLLKLSRQVAGEAHRYKGFVRFQETTGGFYYCAITPDHRILSLIAPHFSSRFYDQHWVIHDMRHGEGIFYDRNRREWIILQMEVNGEPVPVLAEEQFQSLWRSYFAAVSIAERENLHLQRGKVPLKVRPGLVEFARERDCNANESGAARLGAKHRDIGQRAFPPLGIDSHQGDLG